ncbi:hypothetical protein WJX72_007300 [[Myrmecia] bisecta]|uniref:Uncharacterized protein n=1 Tax=[Myrmecia] bisecta TaxID=41462 RepID=A0AAW1P637_9CHLO
MRWQLTAANTAAFQCHLVYTDSSSRGACTKFLLHVYKSEEVAQAAADALLWKEETEAAANQAMRSEVANKEQGSKANQPAAGSTSPQNGTLLSDLTPYFISFLHDTQQSNSPLAYEGAQALSCQSQLALLAAFEPGWGA